MSEAGIAVRGGSHVLLSSERQDWRTPGWFLRLVEAVNCGRLIALDPASSPGNPAGAQLALHQPSDPSAPCGLSIDWAAHLAAHGLAGGMVFVNPPYGAHLSGEVDPGALIVRKGKVIGRGTGWARKIASYDGECIALVPVRSEVVWWRELFAWSSSTLLWSSPTYGSRIAFVDPDTGEEKSGSNLASTVFYRGPRVERFLEVFGPHGTPITALRRAA